MNREVLMLTWNIRCRTTGLGTIAEVVAGTGADVVVLTEYRPRQRGGISLSDELSERGFSYQQASTQTTANTDVRGVLLASRIPLEPLESAAPNVYPERWVAAVLEDTGLLVGGIYLPGRKTGAKQRWWTWLLAQAGTWQDRPAVLLGDFNTGLHRIDELGATLSCTDSMQALLSSGWTDAWRSLHPNERSYSWWSRVGNGFRLDHAFVSERVRVERAEFVTSVADTKLVRTPDDEDEGKGISDHAALLTACTVIGS